MLLHWYDETYRAYYDVHGPVKSLTQSSPQEVDAEGDSVDSEHDAEHWRLFFTAQGRLTRKKRMTGNLPLRIDYRYHDDGRPDSITTYNNDQPWRVTRYGYDTKKQLLNVEFHDLGKDDVLHVKHQRQVTATGWFDMSLPRERVDVLTAHEFAKDGTLLWSSKGGFNNGPGLYYWIKTTDEVISSRALFQPGAEVKKIGGYAYAHYDSGRLRTVISYSADNGGVYHATQYHYANNGLLQSETREVTGNSLFNSAANERVEYHYQQTDAYGNWLQRSVERHTRWRIRYYRQQRQIEYYE